jgi:hypothetical protein
LEPRLDDEESRSREADPRLDEEESRSREVKRRSDEEESRSREVKRRSDEEESRSREVEPRSDEEEPRSREAEGRLDEAAILVDGQASPSFGGGLVVVIGLSSRTSRTFLASEVGVTGFWMNATPDSRTP